MAGNFTSDNIESASTGFWRQFLAGIAGVIVAGAGVLLWYKIRRASSAFETEFALVLMPALIGLAIGLMIRFCRGSGTFGLAGVAVLITFSAGLLGAMLHKGLQIDERLHKFVATTYDETLAYARETAPLQDEEQLRRAFTNNQVMVVGRLANTVETHRLKDFWRVRNFIHLHWIAARQITLYGETGTDHIIWEATKLSDHGPFLDDVIKSLARQPVTKDDLQRFQAQELPFLRKLLNNKLTRDNFESSLFVLARGQFSWGRLVFAGTNVVIGFLMVVGCVIAYKLVRESEAETEMI